MSKVRRILSLALTFLIVLSLIPVNFTIHVLADTVVKSPVVNADGSVTFNYQGNGTETKAIVKGSWDANWTPVEMTKDSNNVWSATITPDKKALYEYGIATWSPSTTDQTYGDWKADPLNSLKASDNNPLLVMSPIINSDKTVTFYYIGDGTETKVIVKGSWTQNWDPVQMTQDTSNPNLWSVKLKLNPGQYEYGIATWSPSTKDNTYGDWKADPLNPNKTGGNPVVNVPSDFTSSVVNSDRTVTFKYQGSATTTYVNLAGDMNGWSQTASPMTKDSNNIWSITTSALTPGKREYKFVVNGSNWITDPQNTNLSSSQNSVVNVPGLYAINIAAQVLQNSSSQATAIGLKADGTDETLSAVNWSVTPDNLATVESDGKLKTKKLPSDKDNIDLTVHATYEGVTVDKTITLVKDLTEQPGGKTVVLVGDIQTVAGANGWAPGDMKTRMLYQGNGLYKITLKNVPAGNYQYKVAIGGSWSENYGANGASNGANISVSVPKNEDVTFYYSDNTHIIVDTTTYIASTPKLNGKDISVDTIMTDYNLTGVYSAKVTLTNGSHDDIVITDGSKTIKVNPIVVSDVSKDVTINYDVITGIVFNDLSNKKIDATSLLFNSKDSSFKTSYGAIATESKVTFSIQAKKDDLTEAKLILLSGTGATVLDMHKNGTFASDVNEQYDRWSVDYTTSATGLYQYYFAVTNGSDVKAYGDDDGYYGTGKADDIGKVGKYDLSVYDKNFKTPDWMKNAVVYQIFPDRFFNGDTSNDYKEQLARGNTAYEYVTDWNAIPEDPNIEYASNGKLNPKYTANVGDGIWNNDVYGGDLKGIQDKLDYLKALGVNTLYLNPISEASSNHRYDTKDYSKVDSILGNMDDYVNLVSEAHKRGMHLILDGVFNHVSDDSIYFDRYGKYVAKGKPLGAYQYWSKVYNLMNSDTSMSQADAEKKVQADYVAQGITDFHYKDWFIIQNSKESSGIYKYNGWNGNDSMPEIQALNNSEHNVTSWAQDIIDGQNSDVKQWLKIGTDGFRLDAADSVSDDTWKYLRPSVKDVNSQDVIIGEIWSDSSKYLLGNMFDSVMNYRFRGAVQEFTTGSGDAVQATKDLEKMREEYPKEAFEALLNIVDSHDTERIISDFDGYNGSDKAIAVEPSSNALAKMKLVPFIQMTYPGAPCIYYGDELGMPGATDPDDRRTMYWGKGNKDVLQWYAELTNIRNSYSVLRTGDIIPITVDDSNAKDVLAYSRNDDTNHALIVANRKTSAISNLQIEVSSIPNGTVLTNALDSTEKYTVVNGVVNINVPAQSGVILVQNYTKVSVNNDALKDGYDPSYKVNSTAIAPVVASGFNSAEISKTVIADAKAKNRPLYIVTGEAADTTFVIKDSKVFDTIANAAITGLKLSSCSELSSTDAVNSIIKTGKSNLLKSIKLENNLPDGKFNGEVLVTTSFDSKYKNQKVYVYYYNPITGKAELVATPTVDYDQISFSIVHCSDYFVTDTQLQETTNIGSNPGDTNNGKGNGTSGEDTTVNSNSTGGNTSSSNFGTATSNTGTATSGSNSSEGTLPKTGGISNSDLIYLGIFISVIGLVMIRRKSEMNN